MKLQAAKAVALAVLLLPAASLAGCNDAPQSAKAQSAPPAPVKVGVVQLKKQNVPYTVELPGRVVAYRTAEIRPQVDGLVRKRVFTEGKEVKAGDVLYQLDPTTFEAAKAAAAASVEKAEATVANAQGKYDRTKQLGKTNAVSTQNVEDAHATLLQAQADRASAKADLQTAQINLNHATITAPIGGLIGKSSISDGALVTANQTDALATIRQLDPVYVDLVQSAASLLRIRAKVKAGYLGKENEGPPPVKLTLDDGSTYDKTGRVDLADVNVSLTTGTFSLRSTFANPDRILLPGMFVRATIDLGDTPNAYLVPEQAVDHDASGNTTVYVVDKNSTIATRTIDTDRIYNNSWVVTAGLQPGDQIVVDGLQYISNGTKVAPSPVSIDKNGAVKNVPGPNEMSKADEPEAGK